MGVVHHSNYLVWFEVGRTNFMDQLGFNYAEMESENLLCPVIDAHLSYKKPAQYGETVAIKTSLQNYDGVRITYEYHIQNEQNETVVSGTTTHVGVKKDSFKPVLLRKVKPEWHTAYTKLVKGVG